MVRAGVLRGSGLFLLSPGPIRVWVIWKEPALKKTDQPLPLLVSHRPVSSEAEREGYVTLTDSAHDAVERVQVRSIHRIADKACSRNPACIRA
jgi:hypothetical protein